MLDSLIESGKVIIAEYGLVGLGVLSFTEAFINPLPISPLMGSAIVMGLPMWPAFFVTLITNLIGAVLGYYLGKWLGHPVAIKIFGKQRIDHAEAFFAKWGEIGVFLAAFTPIPFKIATWAAGIFEMRFWFFFGSAVIGRVMQFLAVLAVFYWGVEALRFLVG